MAWSVCEVGSAHMRLRFLLFRSWLVDFERCEMECSVVGIYFGSEFVNLGHWSVTRVRSAAYVGSSLWDTCIPKNGPGI